MNTKEQQLNALSTQIKAMLQSEVVMDNVCLNAALSLAALQCDNLAAMTAAGLEPLGNKAKTAFNIDDVINTVESVEVEQEQMDQLHSEYMSGELTTGKTMVDQRVFDMINDGITSLTEIGKQLFQKTVISPEQLKNALSRSMFKITGDLITKSN